MLLNNTIIPTDPIQIQSIVLCLSSGRKAADWGRINKKGSPIFLAGQFQFPPLPSPTFNANFKQSHSAGIHCGMGDGPWEGKGKKPTQRAMEMEHK
jgi:hypothetical protein